MSSIIRRFISLTVCLLALGLGLASNPLPAQASGKITVGDDGARCHGSVPTIPAALAALGPIPKGKIVVCAGVYTDPVAIAGANGLTLIGNPGAVLKAPSGFTGIMLSVLASKKVTVKGFTFDGQGSLGSLGSSAAQATAIFFYRSSGVITRNTIVNWHTPGFALSNFYMAAIRADEDARQSIAITRNTISDFQSRGIVVAGLAKVNISGNALNTTGASADKPVGIQVGDNPQGGKISGNTITSDQFPSGSYEQVAIWVFEGSKFKVTRNTIIRWYWGIALESDGYTTIPTNKNSVTGNKIYETGVGVIIRSNAWGAYDAHADQNRIAGNTIKNTVTQGLRGVIVTGGDPAGGPSSFALLEVVKGNKITFFAQGAMPDPASNTTITGKFTGNTIR